MTNTVVSKYKTGRGRTRRPNRAGLGRTGHAVGKYVEDAASLGVRTLRGLNELRKLINIETKVINTNIASTTFSSGGAITCLSQVAQGTDYTSRVGDSIRIQHLDVFLRFYQSALATQSTLRCILFRDLDNPGIAPAITDVMDASVSSPNVLAQYNWLNRDRFSILYDNMFTLNAAGDTSLAMEYHSPHQGHVKYLGTTGAAGSNGKGSVYMLVVTDEGTNTPSYSYNARLCFTDD